MGAIALAWAATLTTAAGAAFVELTYEEVDFSEYPQWSGLVTIDVFARFDHPEDCLFAGFGNSDHPTWIITDSPSGFFNEPYGLGGDAPPHCSDLDEFPELRWDTFVTIALDCDDQDRLELSPGFPPIEGSEWYADNAAWFELVYDLGRAGDYPDLKVRLARITVDELSMIDMMFNLYYELGDGGYPVEVFDVSLFYQDLPPEILHVPDEYPTIQAAIDAACHGDVVEIADGTYMGAGNVNLDFHGKAITVRSASDDPDLCVIDCEELEETRSFYFHNGETAGSIVRGVTLTGGNEGIGGGICVEGSSPSIVNCIISNNDAFEEGFGGGAVYCQGGNVTFTECSILGNIGFLGGAIRCNEGTLTLRDCIISNNGSIYSGGGIEGSDSDIVCVDCSITSNYAFGFPEYGARGGGVCCTGGSLTLVNCKVTGNDAENGGGGGTGGGIVSSNAHLTVVNCLVRDNKADDDPPYGEGRGGAIYCSGGTASVTNCTIISNDASIGGALYSSDCNPDLSNCILWSNSPDQIYVDSGSPVVRYSDIQGGWSGTGNIDADPLLGAPGYHLSADSPCIDAADNTAVPADTFDLDDDGNTGEKLPIEFEGHPRFVDDPDVVDTGNGQPPIVDMGACEWPVGPHTFHVPEDFGTIQAAIDWSYDGDTVEVADGVYTGVGNKDLHFFGKAITVRSISGDPESCVIDCEGEGRGFTLEDGEGPDSIVQGFTVTNGHDNHGGGVLCEGSPRFIDCAITSNQAWDGGCGICCWSVGSPTFINCTVADNKIQGHARGGGLECWGSNPTLVNCVITANEGESGSGIFCFSTGSTTLVNCLISDNDYGSGVYCYYESAVTLVNCTVSGNLYDSSDAGGVYVCSDGASTLIDCVIWGNNAPQLGGAGALDVTYSDIEGGWSGTGNIDADPLFVDPDNGDYHIGAGSPCIDAADNTAVPPDWFDLDEDEDTDEPTPFDLDGNPRFHDDPGMEDTGYGDPPIVDMGAYEFQVEESCPADFDDDGDVDTADLLFLLGAWGTPDGDVDGDGDTDTADLLALLGAWGDCP